MPDNSAMPQMPSPQTPGTMGFGPFTDTQGRRCQSQVSDHATEFLPSPYPSHLPYVLPFDKFTRIMIFAVRRMAAHGLNDAHAANAMLGIFGLNYRRPLVLLRALMLEMAAQSRRSIMIAPCCCPRMTEDEMRIMCVIGIAENNFADCHALMGILLDSSNCLGPVSSALALSAAMEDYGKALVWG